MLKGSNCIFTELQTIRLYTMKFLRKLDAGLGWDGAEYKTTKIMIAKKTQPIRTYAVSERLQAIVAVIYARSVGRHECDIGTPSLLLYSSI